MRDEVWTLKDGKEILVKDMTSQHIVNAIALCERKKKALEIELKRRIQECGGDPVEVEKKFETVKNERLRDLKADMRH